MVGVERIRIETLRMHVLARIRQVPLQDRRCRVAIGHNNDDEAGIGRVRYREGVRPATPIYRLVRSRAVTVYQVIERLSVGCQCRQHHV